MGYVFLSYNLQPCIQSAFKNKRCLIPANGFYEWQKLEKGNKQTYYISTKDEVPFAFAGLWEKWHGISYVTSCIEPSPPDIFMDFPWNSGHGRGFIVEKAGWVSSNYFCFRSHCSHRKALLLLSFR